MTYELKNSQLTVAFTTKGGALSSIKDKEGMEYLWQGNANYWSGQAPVLFPICGSIREDKAMLENGKEVAMPRHGLVRKQDFVFENITENTICFSITSTEETMQYYPFEYKLFITYTLEGKTITTSYLVENHSKETMPFFIGGHPGFRCPLKEGESYDDYEVQFEVEENCSVPTPISSTGLIDMKHRTTLLEQEKILKLHHGLFQEDAIILDQLKSRKVKMVHKENGNGVEVVFSEFPYLILWSTPNQGPFLAIEPWSGLSTCSDEDDILEHKRNVIKLKKGQAKRIQFKIRVID